MPAAASGTLVMRRSSFSTPSFLLQASHLEPAAALPRLRWALTGLEISGSSAIVIVLIMSAWVLGTLTNS